MSEKKDLPEDLKDLECRNIFCLNCDGEICMLFDRKSQLNSCIAKKQFDLFVKSIDRDIEVHTKLSEIFDSDEWWWHKRTREPFSSPITNCLKKVKDRL